VSSRRAARILNVADARGRARRALPRVLYDYVDGGAEDELAVAESVSAFRNLELLPRMGIGVGEPEIAATVLGTRLALPVLLAPCGFVELMHRDGARGAARAAAAAGTVSVLSRTALCPPEELAAGAPGPHWFQINASGGRERVAHLIERAAAAGFSGLMVTLDGPPLGNHERNRRHGIEPPVRVTPRLVARIGPQLAARPRWALAMAPAGLRAMRRRPSAVTNASEVLGDHHEWPRFAWSDIEWMRERWPGQLVLKGLLTGTDASAARDAGADAVVVSNHGGRQLDGVPAPIDALPEVVAAVGGSTAVLLDGGVRRATDVVKALSLGASAVMIGRPFVYGLAAAGQPGVERILEIFAGEIARTLRLIGCGGLAELDPSWLRDRRSVPSAL
jgi:isopentenyl diphosphate isomerase/L-lactate dehydrogenase-like FMN-dependent dehydrogenase